jgi:hypothetical protein
MKKMAKYMAFLVVGLVLLFLFVANFSAKESKFECKGELVKDGASNASTIFIKLTEYRPWVGLWGNSTGSLHLEIPNEWVEYYDHLEVVGNQLHIFETYPTKTVKGSLSNLSQALLIETALGTFKGTCVQSNR